MFARPTGRKRLPALGRFETARHSDDSPQSPSVQLGGGEIRADGQLRGVASGPFRALKSSTFDDSAESPSLSVTIGLPSCLVTGLRLYIGNRGRFWRSFFI